LGSELRSLTNIARRWWWLLIVAPLLGVIVGLLISSRQETLYAATAQLVINPSAGQGSIDSGTIQGAQNLANTYQQLITTWPVLDPVIQKLNLPYGRDELRSKITTEAVPNTLILTVTASDGQPEQAATLANTVAQQFHDYMTIQSKAAKVDIVLAVPAQTPTASYAPRTALYAALGGMLALLGACGLVVAWEYFDRSIKSPLEAVAAVDASILATLPYDRKLKRSSSGLLPMLTNSADPYAEAVRQLRTRILNVRRSRGRVRLAITSPHTDDGRSTIAANLAIAFAYSGFTVALIDADFRNSSLHERFEVINDRGLSTLLLHPDQSWHSVTANVKIPNLSLIPTGPVVQDAIDLLDGGRLRPILDDIEEVTDVILVDTPGLLDYGDAFAIGNQVAAAIVVCRVGRTTTGELQLAVANLLDAEVAISGMVLNRQKVVSWNRAIVQAARESLPELSERATVDDDEAIKSLLHR